LPLLKFQASYLFHKLLKTEYALPQAVKIILNVSDKLFKGLPQKAWTGPRGSR